MEEWEDEPDVEPPKSMNCERFSLVTFICRTKRNVDIFWLNYTGERVKYTTIPWGGTYHVTTFVTHPWIFRDGDTGDVLAADNQEVFYPRAWSEKNPQWMVYIDIPVFTLRERCLQVVRRLVPDKEDIIELHLPKVILRDLLQQEEEPHHSILHF